MINSSRIIRSTSSSRANYKQQLHKQQLKQQLEGKQQLKQQLEGKQQRVGLVRFLSSSWQLHKQQLKQQLEGKQQLITGFDCRPQSTPMAAGTPALGLCV